MPTDKERFLAVATPWQWGWWLAGLTEDTHSTKTCLVCKSYPKPFKDQDCCACTGARYGCIYVKNNRGNEHRTHKEMTHALINRLSKAGLFDEED